MGVIYNSFKQEPFEYSHITAWGQIGGINSWESSHTMPVGFDGYNPDLSQREKYFEPLFSLWTNGYSPVAQPINFRTNISEFSACFNNLAVFNEIGFGVGNFRDAGSYNSNNNNYLQAHFEMVLNGSELLPDVSHPSIFYEKDNIKYINENIMACGSNHVLAMYTDSNGSTLYAWGKNNNNQCNIPTTLNVSNVKMVTAGHRHSVALENNGNITVWGLTSSGQNNIPVGITADYVTSGLNHILALSKNGTVYAWGDNFYGQATVPFGLTGCIAIGAGHKHSMAIRENGSVVCWGMNDNGQCNVPASVGTGGLQIAGGLEHTALLKKDGSVICWGNNTYRQASIPGFPDPLPLTYFVKDETLQTSYPTVGLTGSTTKVFCTKYATIALCTARKTINQIYSYTEITFYPAPLIQYGDTQVKFLPGPQIGNHVAACGLWGVTNSQVLHGLSCWGRYNGYNPSRHDYYTYPSEIQNPLDEIFPTGLNTDWWSGAKLDKCWISGYQSTPYTVTEGISYYIKIYDDFSPPDLSGCSIRPRCFGKPWAELNGAWPIDLINIQSGPGSYHYPNTSFGYFPPTFDSYIPGTARYHSFIYDIPNNWNLFNSGFWTNILITKKHALACKHFAGPNNVLNNVQWIRRDGIKVTRNLTKVYDFGDWRYLNVYSNQFVYPVDWILYELDSELTQDDLNNMSVYNVWPTVTGFTGSKLIDTKAAVRKTGGYVTSDRYNDVKFMSQVGRKVYALDGQDRVYCKRISKVIDIHDPNQYLQSPLENLGDSVFISHKFSVVDPFPHEMEPDNIACDLFIGDSGTPYFITAAPNNPTAIYPPGYVPQGTSPLQLDYFAGQGITVARTLFLGTLEMNNIFTTEFTDKLNSFLTTRGLSLSECIQRVEIDNDGPGIFWAVPIAGGVTYNVGLIPDYSGTGPNLLSSVFSSGQNLLQTTDFKGTATVTNWDSTKKLLTVKGVTGSVVTPGGSTGYSLVNTNEDRSSTLYTNSHPYVIALNNNLGTTAGINDVIDEEAILFNIDKNEPC
jgi:hypothetical protein